MVYIHVKKVGNQKYYTLRISVRKGNQVITKDLCNLGSDLSKVNLDSLEKKYKDKIRKSYRTLKNFLERNIYLEKVKNSKLKKNFYLTKQQQLDVEAILHHYKKKFLKEHILTQAEIFESFLINFAVNSTSIEGNTITLKQAYNLFKENILPKNKTLREVHDLTNTKKVIDYLKDKKPKIDAELLIKIHDMLLENIDMRKGFRNHDIKILGQPFKPSSARYVKADVNVLLDWYKENKNKLHPLILAILFHHKFENIHPFSDGNGRTGRVLMNHILDLLGYPPIVISNRHREQYLNSMKDADEAIRKGLKGDDPKKYKLLVKFIHSEYKTSYWDIFLI
ncbi:MAG: Fic family protein [Nanoarchaeota archaeon]|nr:Fic family protein [Nanoarchaeota archaeon]